MNRTLAYGLAVWYATLVYGSGLAFLAAASALHTLFDGVAQHLLGCAT